jgi:hypothetical protein
MSEYRNLKGRKIKFLTSDLSGEAAEGQIFYSDTNNDFKSVVASAAWSSGGNLVLGTGLMAGAGTQTAALGFGGYIGPGTPNVVATTLEYNGNGWTSSGNLAAARSGMGGTGTQTAALGFGGATTIPRGPGEVANSEEYNGTTWAEGNNLNDALVGIGGLGTQTAAVGFGGGTPNVSATEHYDGTSWTNVPGTLTSARRYLQGCGTQTAGLTAGGDGTSSNHYDGSAWTAGGNLNTGRPNTGAVSGIQTSALMSGGASGGTPVGGKTEEYNGTSWSEIADMAVARYASAGANGGTTSASVAFGGYLGGTGYISSTEEFNRTVNTITGAAWASGGNTSHRTVGRLNFGTQTAAFAGGGVYVPNPGYTDESKTEEYNGSSWTAGTDMPADKGRGTGHGTLTAGLVCGGTAGNTNTNTSFEYDGTNWTAGGNMNVARRYMGGFGIQTAAVICGGFPSPTNNGTETEEYNGSAWTAVTATPTKSQTFQASGGTLTAGIYFGGEDGSGAKTSESFEYDGTNWTAGGDLNEATARNSGGGTLQTATMAVGGLTTSAGPGSAVTQLYDGTSWRTSASMAVARSQIGAFTGTTSSGLINNGINASDAAIVTTEEFTGETTALNIKTLTDS